MTELPVQQPLSNVLEDAGKIVSETANPMRMDGSNSMDSLMSKVKVDRVWVPDFASEWMYCMVLPPESMEDGTYESYTGKIQTYGLEVFSYSTKDNKVVVLIRPSEDIVSLYADEINFKMKTNVRVLKEIMEKGDEEKEIAGVDIRHDPSVASYEPYEMIFLPYSTQVPTDLYENTDKQGTSPFSHSVKARLTGLLLETKPKWGGENIKVERYLNSGKILAYFPLHEPLKLAKLHKVWLSIQTLPWSQPFFYIKEYFGEKVGIYFLFQGHYTRWLLGPALVGFLLQVIGAGIYKITQEQVDKDPRWTNDMVGETNWKEASDAPYLPFYSAYLCLWAIFMLEKWKATQSKFALEWGMDGYEEGEPDMPEYRGEKTTSLIDGSYTRFFPSEQRRKLEMQSVVAVIAMICVVLGCVASIYVIKDTLVGDGWQVNTAQTVASVFNALQIQAANYLYQLAATELTKRENHRTMTAYEDALVQKTFAFQFVNSYASFFYVGFFAEHIQFNKIACESEFGCCGIYGCMYALGINLAVIFGTRLATGIVTTVVLPWVIKQGKRCMGCCSRVVMHQEVPTRPEKEFELARIDPSSEITANFSETAIQMGYQCLFAAALPVASTFALVSNLIDVKGKAWQLLRLFQRPRPMMVEDIGAFQGIFTAIAACSVITNMSLVKFTMTTLDSWPINDSWWAYMSSQWVLFFLMAAGSKFVQDESTHILYQKARAKFYASKIIDKKRDDTARHDPAPEHKIPLAEYPKGGGFEDMISADPGNMK